MELGQVSAVMDGLEEQSGPHQNRRETAVNHDINDESSEISVIPLQSAHLCRFHGVDQQQHLALRVGPGQYTFYRRQTSLDRARALVQQWQRRGHDALTTQDDGHYAVWVKDLYRGMAGA